MFKNLGKKINQDFEPIDKKKKTTASNNKKKRKTRGFNKSGDENEGDDKNEYKPYVSYVALKKISNELSGSARITRSSRKKLELNQMSEEK